MWRDVERVLDVRPVRPPEFGTGDQLCFVLRPGAKARPVDYGYFDARSVHGWGRAQLKPPGLRITVEACRAEAVEAVKRLYGKPLISITSSDLADLTAQARADRAR